MLGENAYSSAASWEGRDKEHSVRYTVSSGHLERCESKNHSGLTSRFLDSQRSRWPDETVYRTEFSLSRPSQLAALEYAFSPNLRHFGFLRMYAQVLHKQLMRIICQRFKPNCYRWLRCYGRVLLWSSPSCPSNR